MIGLRDSIDTIYRWYRQIDRQIDIHTVGYYLAIKNEILPFAAMWMDLENIMLSDIRQRKTNITYKCNLKSNRSECVCKTGTDSQIQKTNL